MAATQSSSLRLFDLFALATPLNSGQGFSGFSLLAAAATPAKTTASPPVVTAHTENQIWASGKPETLTLATNTFTDPQKSALTFSASLAGGGGLPTWLKFTPATDSFTGTPPIVLTPLSVTVTAKDSLGLSVSETFTISLASAPRLTSQTANQIWAPGKPVGLTLATNTFTDPQQSPLTFSATLTGGGALPAWLKFNPATDSFSATTPTSAAPISVTVTAKDAYGLTASDTFTISLASAPKLTAQTATQTWTQGQAVSFSLAANTFTDPQGSALSYSATLANGAALPSWLKFNATTHSFSGTEPSGTAAFSLKVTATDSYGLSVSDSFAVATPAPAPVVPPASSGFVINVHYDSSVASAPSGFKTAVNAAVTYLESQFTNAMTLNINVGYGEVGGSAMVQGALGESETSFLQESYATVDAALKSHASSADQLAAVATLPATAPISGMQFLVSTGEAKALGLAAASGTAIDGSVGLASMYPMSYDPANRAASGTYDAIGTLEHEITEVMGRIGNLNNYGEGYTPLDLFRYSAPGVRDLTPSAGYFSVDGKTMLTQYNNPATGGDAADWTPSVVGDSFGSGRAGVAALVSTTDLREMNVLGYTRAVGTV